MKKEKIAIGLILIVMWGFLVANFFAGSLSRGNLIPGAIYGFCAMMIILSAILDVDNHVLRHVGASFVMALCIFVIGHSRSTGFDAATDIIILSGLIYTVFASLSILYYCFPPKIFAGK